MFTGILQLGDTFLITVIIFLPGRFPVGKLFFSIGKLRFGIGKLFFRLRLSVIIFRPAVIQLGTRVGKLRFPIGKLFLTVGNLRFRVSNLFVCLVDRIIITGFGTDIGQIFQPVGRLLHRVFIFIRKDGKTLGTLERQIDVGMDIQRIYFLWHQHDPIQHAVGNGRRPIVVPEILRQLGDPDNGKFGCVHRLGQVLAVTGQRHDVSQFPMGLPE